MHKKGVSTGFTNALKLLHFGYGQNHANNSPRIPFAKI